MSLRSLVTGIFLGLLLAVTDYYSTSVIRQFPFSAGQLPSGVFGIALFLLLVWNPLAGGISTKWVLKKAELGVIVALGLAICGGLAFLRSFTPVLAMPSHLLKSKTSWQAVQVMSYVPGASPLLAEGFIRNWPELCAKLAKAKSGTTPTPAGRVWELLPADTQNMLAGMAGKRSPDDSEKAYLWKALNVVLKRSDFFDERAFAGIAIPTEAKALLERQKKGALSDRDLQRMNRLLIDAAFPGEISPLPAGSGVLLNGGQTDPVAVDLLIQGSNKRLGLTDLPWAIWWPVLRLWLGLTILFVVASLCLALIVHPQWTKRELLPYPIARFIQEVTEPSPGGRWPNVATSKLFWCGFGLLFGLHILNGLNAWFPTFIKFPFQYDFSSLNQIFPDAAKVPNASLVFNPTIFCTVVAFAFFLNTEVSFSLGLMGFLYLAVGGMLVRNGVSLTSSGVQESNFTMLGFGAYLASSVMVLYIGRHYYRDVAGSVVGLCRQANTPAYAKWAARGLVVCSVLIALLLMRAGLDWFMSVILLLLMLMTIFTVSRIYAETGALMVQTAWKPAGILLGVFGFEGMGPGAFGIISLAGTILILETRDAWMPYFVHALRIGENTAEVSPRRMAAPLLTVAIGGLLVALCATFLVQYNYGLNQADRWTVEWLPAGTFDKMVAIISELSAHNQLGDATVISGLHRLGVIDPQPGVLLWIGLGMALVFGCSIARLRLAWWPIHPVLFLVWGTYAGYKIGVSFLLGWLVKLSVTKLGGARGYHAMKPLMVGIIAGEIAAALLWFAVGAIYYFNTGLKPNNPSIFP